MKQRLMKIQDQCLEGRLGVDKAVTEIDRAIGGITRVVYQPGLKFKIHNHQGDYQLKYKGLRKKALKNLYKMALAAYFKAQENGSLKPGEVHLGKGASTKHYKDGAEDYLN
ncbi:hypothetical protein ACFLZB_03685 [Nanoarchaeota archaeon]